MVESNPATNDVSNSQRLLDAVLFDVDGTLIDSVDQHAAAWQEAFRHFGKEIPLPRIRSQVGKGADQLLPVFLSHEEQDGFGADLTRWRTHHFADRYLAKLRPFVGVRPLFERLRSDGIKIAVASSARAEELTSYLRCANIEDLIDGTTSSDDVDRSKPHPDLFDAALARLGVPAARAAVVGDTPHDMSAAARANVRPIGVLSGGFPRDQLINAGAVEVYSGVEELLSLYPGWLCLERDPDRPVTRPGDLPPKNPVPGIDEAVEESFPASDPPAYGQIVGVGRTLP